ncbi:hypothetical protein [Cupriavidus sp. DL-D2]|uniref:hypothetical protein n=1 Tax=Cupriavidus sp. DL-D2 TaxID=3144974 RepID=UPI003213EAC9
MLTPHIGRLQRLRALIATKPEEVIDLDTWACGTVFCAVGWATQDPEFQKEGLTLGYHAPMFEGKHDWAAVTAFFGITEGQAEYLFLNKRDVPYRYYRDDGEKGELIPADDAEVLEASDKVLVLHRLDTFISNAKVSA